MKCRLCGREIDFKLTSTPCQPLDPFSEIRHAPIPYCRECARQACDDKWAAQDGIVLKGDKHGQVQ